MRLISVRKSLPSLEDLVLQRLHASNRRRSETYNSRVHPSDSAIDCTFGTYPIRNADFCSGTAKMFTQLHTKGTESFSKRSTSGKAAAQSICRWGPAETSHG